MKGEVKFYNKQKNFGFIVGEDNNEYFIHSSGLSDGTTILNESDKVLFDVEEGDRGPKAVNVTLHKG